MAGEYCSTSSAQVAGHHALTRVDILREGQRYPSTHSWVQERRTDFSVIEAALRLRVYLGHHPRVQDGGQKSVMAAGH